MCLVIIWPPSPDVPPRFSVVTTNPEQNKRRERVLPTRWEFGEILCILWSASATHPQEETLQGISIHKNNCSHLLHNFHSKVLWGLSSSPVFMKRGRERERMPEPFSRIFAFFSTLALSLGWINKPTFCKTRHRISTRSQLSLELCNYQDDSTILSFSGA